LSLRPFATKAAPKHAKPSVVSTAGAPIAVGGALTAGFLVAGASAAQAQATDSQLAALRQCESGGNYRTNTGNGYYGAYQFSAGTWRSLGYSGLPHNASPATQDRAARDLQSRSGWGQWPACTRKLGLRGGGGGPTSGGGGGDEERASRSTTRTAVPVTRRTAPPVTRVYVPAYVVPKTAPLFKDSTVIVKGAKYSPQVKAWQARMAQRGWRIAADGYFGPKSSSVAKRFAAEKKIAANPTGSLNKTVFVGAWKLAVT
jgi:hypothetical protein